MKIRYMMPVVGFLAVGTTAVFPFGRRPDPQVSLENVSLDVMIDRDGRPTKTGKLAPRSAGTRALHSLLEKKKGQWRRSFISYAPNIYVKSDNFNINVQCNVVIVNYKNKRGKYTQAVCPLTEEEFEQVQRAVFECIEGQPNQHGEGKNGPSRKGARSAPRSLGASCW